MSGLLLALLSPALADEAPAWGGRQVEEDEPVETSLVSASAELSGSLESLAGDTTGDLQPTRTSAGASLESLERAPGGSLQSLGGGSAAEARRISPSEAQAVLKSAYPQLHACVQEHVGPERVEITLEIDVWIDGSVQQVRYEDQLGEASEACMTAAIRRLRFSSPGGEVAVPVRSSLWFAGASEPG